VNARANILARIRLQQGRSGTTTEAEREQIRGDMRKHLFGPQPDAAHPRDAIAQFKNECARLLTTVAEVPSLNDVPREVARYCAETNSGTDLVGWTEHAELDWRGAGLRYEARPAESADRNGFTGCFCAIAETGTLLLLSSPATPKTPALLPETHICVVRRDRIVGSMEEAFALVRSEIGEPPRAMYFVSGPSRTADIEQTIVIGAHGPYRVHVILV
jgi:L-lactate dehydrogenase complex protein LldG